MHPLRRGQNRILAILLGCILSGTAFGHARFKLDGLFKPRTNDPGLKTAPCGGAARTNTPVSLTPGQQVTVEWEETVDHPGFFRLSFSPANDLGFESNVIADNIVDTQNDGKTPHFYSKQITLPNQTCTACTLQLIQVMTENPAAPTNYYSCSDMQLLAAAAPPNDVIGVRTISVLPHVLQKNGKARSGHTENIRNKSAGDFHPSGFTVNRVSTLLR